jgi:hypothetical protein
MYFLGKQVKIGRNKLYESICTNGKIITFNTKSEANEHKKELNYHFKNVKFKILKF